MGVSLPYSSSVPAVDPLKNVEKLASKNHHGLDCLYTMHEVVMFGGSAKWTVGRFYSSMLTL